MGKQEKLEKLRKAKALLEEAVQLAADALEGDGNADAYFLSTLREITGYGGNPYNQRIDIIIKRVEAEGDEDREWDNN